MNSSNDLSGGNLQGCRAIRGPAVSFVKLVAAGLDKSAQARAHCAFWQAPAKNPSGLQKTPAFADT
jgi:hypothetical protein